MPDQFRIGRTMLALCAAMRRYVEWMSPLAGTARRLTRLSLLRWLADGGDVAACVSWFLRVRLGQHIFSTLKEKLQPMDYDDWIWCTG